MVAPAEEQFYATWPIVLAILKPGLAVWIVVGVAAATLLLQCDLLPLGTNSPVAFLLAHIPAEICWGSLAACLLHDKRTYSLCWRLMGGAWGGQWVATPIAALAAAGAIAEQNTSTSSR